MTSPAEHGSRPLTGLLVLDFSRVLAGPFATVLLADLGARVIKVEPPGGDDYRHIGPFVGEASALFAFANRGKESIVLDLKKPGDIDLARSLAARADVVVENFRPGIADKLGIGATALMGANERLVYASISGFGQTGPLSGRPAYDIIVQALTGLMSVTGDPSGPPTMIGEALGDLSAGLFASWAILAALYQRELTGRGSRIDVAMFDALLSMMPTATCRYLATGLEPTRVGNRHPLSAPFGAFRTRDGHVVVAVLNEKLFHRFAEAIGRPDLLEDARFATDAQRTAHEPILREAFESWSGQLGADEVVTRLSEAGIPAAPIETVGRAVDSDHARHRELFRSMLLDDRELRIPEQPALFSTAFRGAPAPVPDLDQHGSEIREWLRKASAGETPA